MPVLGFTDDAAVARPTAIRLVATQSGPSIATLPRAALKRGIDQEA